MRMGAAAVTAMVWLVQWGGYQQPPPYGYAPAQMPTQQQMYQQAVPQRQQVCQAVPNGGDPRRGYAVGCF